MYDFLHRPNRLGITRVILNHWWFHIVEEFHNHQRRLRQWFRLVTDFESVFNEYCFWSVKVNSFGNDLVHFWLTGWMMDKMKSLKLDWDKPSSICMFCTKRSPEVREVGNQKRSPRISRNTSQNIFHELTNIFASLQRRRDPGYFDSEPGVNNCLTMISSFELRSVKHLEKSMCLECMKYRGST